MSFIVQISPFVHLFALKIVFRWGWGGLASRTPIRALPWTCWGLKRPPDPSPQVVPTFHFIPSYTPGGEKYILDARNNFHISRAITNH
jgi:hypothetical protein